MWELEPMGRKADITCIGKALSGGFGPASGIVADADIMNVLKIGEHGSTYGGNPFSMAIAKVALEVIVEENLVENSHNMGTIMRKNFTEITKDSKVVREVRGQGLINCIEIEKESNVNGHDFTNICLQNGLITKATKDYICRFTPALVITEDEVNEVSDIVNTAVKQLEDLNSSRQK